MLRQLVTSEGGVSSKTFPSKIIQKPMSWFESSTIWPLLQEYIQYTRCNLTRYRETIAGHTYRQHHYHEMRDTMGPGTILLLL